MRCCAQPRPVCSTRAALDGAAAAAKQAAAVAARGAAAQGDERGRGGCRRLGEAAAAGSGDAEQRLRATLAQQQARAAALELQVGVLAAQLLRSHAACARVRRSVLPLLGGVEARLLGLKAKAASKERGNT